MLRPKSHTTKSNELRFETDEDAELPNGLSSVGHAEELVIMDSVAFLKKDDIEYVFKKGMFFADNTKDGERAWDYAYSLVAPVSKAPMSLFLTAKK